MKKIIKVKAKEAKARSSYIPDWMVALDDETEYNFEVIENKLGTYWIGLSFREAKMPIPELCKSCGKMLTSEEIEHCGDECVKCNTEHEEARNPQHPDDERRKNNAR